MVTSVEAGSGFTLSRCRLDDDTDDTGDVLAVVGG
jgi:hypothetical protein